jgi:ABC-type dipeptide/oligopeptide/nickel transport system permease subunit
MDLELRMPVALGIVAAIIAAGTGGLFAMDVMARETVLMMVLPSMVVFALVVFGLGVKAGEHRMS